MSGKSAAEMPPSSSTTSSQPNEPRNIEEQDDGTTKIVSSELKEMYLQNGNGGAQYFGYLPYRYLPNASTSAQTAAQIEPPSISNGIPPAPSRHYNHNANNYPSNDSDKDIINVPAAVLRQLDLANQTIAAQITEIERLKSYQNQTNETKLLKSRISDMEKEMRSSRARFLEQQEIIAKMNREMDNQMSEKLYMQNQLHEMERKYKKAKMASRELAKILENDMCSGSGKKINGGEGGFESDDEEQDYLRNSNNDSLYHRSRIMSRQQDVAELKAKAEKSVEKAEERKRNDTLQMEARSSRELMEKVIIDNENLLFELDRERRMSESLQGDLEKNRRMVIDRDEKFEDLKAKLAEAETKANQCETDLCRTCTDLALERARCDALTLELHELDTLFAQSQSTIQAFAIENEQLEEKYKNTHQTLVSLNAKLEAQGIDLVTTKKTLKTLREAFEKRTAGPQN